MTSTRPNLFTATNSLDPNPIQDPNPAYVRGTDRLRQSMIQTESRGRGYSYPWLDESYGIGEWFWKSVSKTDWDAGRGRPAIPPKDHLNGRKWKTTKRFNADRREHGYMVERVK
jgi:hypothetical protein